MGICPDVVNLVMEPEIFVSYSWDTKAHEIKVLDFVNRLREDGFNATMDKKLSGEQSAINFIRMMHEAMQKHPWVIVVLSSGYKTKAESFEGGVGTEYELLLGDIRRNPKKYILASFDGRKDDVVPLGLQDRDLHDLNKPSEIERLHRKLLGQDEYEFAPVGGAKPSYPTMTVDQIRANRAAEENKDKIALSEITAKVGGSQMNSGGFHHIDYRLTIQLENISGATIDGFGWELRLPKWLLPDYYLREVEGDHVVIRGQSTKKFYGGAKQNLPLLDTTLRSHEARKVDASEITLSVFGDQLSQKFSKALNKVLRIPHPQHRAMGDMDFDADYFA
jgi:hypothetical protein